MTWWSRWLWVWGLLLCTHGALAQDAGSSSDEEARGFFIAGRAAYMAGRYDEALERFERSYEMSARVELLYNIGTAAERAGKLARALEAYRAYLVQQPDSAVHEDVQARIRALEGRIAEEPEAAPAPELAAAPPPTPRRAADAPKGVLGPSLSLASSGALLATGIALSVVGYQAQQRVHDAPQGSMWSDYEDDAERAVALRAAGISLGAVGVVGAVLSTWWLVRRRKDARRTAMAAVVVGRGFVGYRGSF